MTTTAISPKQQRPYDIAERLRKFSCELERVAESYEPDGNPTLTGEALQQAASFLDDAAGTLEDVRLP